MKKIYSFSNLTFLQKAARTAKRLSFVLGFIFITASIANAAARFSVASGNWNSTATWSTTSGGAPGAPIPVAGDAVTIEGGFNVTVTAAAACTSITFTVTTATSLTISSGITLTVSGAITIPRSGAGENLIAVGSGTLNAGSIAFTSPGTSVRHEITISTGTVTVSGAIDGTGGTGSPSITFTGAGLLQVGTSIFTNAQGTLTPSTGTVEYNAAGAQTVGDFIYNNLILSNSGAKTVTGTTINGTLSLQGTSTAAGTSPTYGATAILEYKGSAAQTTTNVEFPAAMSGGVTINNAAGVTLNAAKTVSGLLTMTSGTLNMANTNLSVGSLTGSSDLTHSSGAAGNRTLTIGTDNTSPAAYSGVISNGTATSVLLVKTGTGTSILSGSNSYTGTTTISNGTLSINTLQNVSGGNSSLGAPTTVANGTISVAGTGVLQYTGSGHSSDRVITVSADGGTIDASGSGTLTLTGGEPGNNNNLVLTGTGVGVETGVIAAGNGSLTKNGTGTWTLSGANTYTGATAINAGILQLGVSTAVATSGPLGTNAGGVTVAAGAALDLNGFSYTAAATEALTLNGTGISGGGALTNSSATASSYIGLISLGSASSIVTNAGDINVTNVGTITGATLGLTLGGSGNGSVASIIGTTSGTVTKNGAGKWTLSALNTYTGTTTINAGILSINSLQNVGSGSSSLGAPTTPANGTIALGATGTLQYTGTGHTSNRIINLTASGGTIDASGSGAFTLTGGVTGNTFNLVLTGTGAGVESTTAIGTTSGTVTKNGAGVWTLSATNTFTGGTTLNAGTLNINNLQALGTVAGTFTIAGGTIDNTSGANITTLNYPLALNGDFTYSGSVPRNLNFGTGAVTMNADRQITVSAGTLTIGGVLSQSTLSLTKAGAGTLSFGASAVTLKGLTISAGTLVSTSGTMNLAGDFSNSGTFTHNSGTVNFNGSASQSIGGTVSATFSTIIFNNSLAGIAITVAKGATISTVATFTAGIVSTSASNLLTFNGGATTSVSSNTAFVDGPVRKVFNAAEGFTFPVGVNGTGDEPLGITGAAVGNDFTAQYLRSSATAMGGVTPPLQNVSNCDQWTLTKNSAPATSVSVTLSWDANSPCNGSQFITSPSGLTVAHFTGPNWDQAGTSGSFTGTSTAGTVTRNAVTAFSPFALGNTAANQNALPVKLGNITGYEKQSGIQIDWTAYSENNLSHYEIERSADGKTFNTVGQVVALNSMSETKYGWFDATPFAGVNFYRLKSVDMDARAGYSSIIKVNLDKASKAITIYPNPVQDGHVSFQSSDLAKGNYTVRIYNNSGQQVYSQNFIHNGGAISRAIQLPQSMKPGMYSLQLENDGSKVMSKPFMVQ